MVCKLFFDQARQSFTIEGIHLSLQVAMEVRKIVGELSEHFSQDSFSWTQRNQTLDDRV